MDSLTFSGSVLKSYLAIRTLPFCIGRRVVRTLITVLFPAPFGPRKEKISPSFTAKLILSTAFTSSKKYSSPFTSMILSSRTSTSSIFFLKEIEPSVINRFFINGKLFLQFSEKLSLKRKESRIYFLKYVFWS